MKFLCLGDLHIQNDNLSDIDRYLEKLEIQLHTEPPDVSIIMGDTLHHHELVYTQCLNKMFKYVELLARYSSHVYILVGNHDMINHLQFLNDQHCLNGFKNRAGITVVDDVLAVPIAESKEFVILMPFVPDGRMVEALTLRTEEKWKSASCIFCHQSIDGAKMGAIKVEGVEEWKADYPMIVSGHIHDKQQPQKNVYYTGSSIQVAYGEAPGKTICYVCVEDQNVDVAEVNVKPPTKTTLYADVSEIKDIVIPFEEDVKYKLSVSGNSEEFKTFKKTPEYKKLITAGVKVVFKQRKIRVIGEELKEDEMVIRTTRVHRPFSDILFDLVKHDVGMSLVYGEVIHQRQAPKNHFENPEEIDLSAANDDDVLVLD